MTWRRHDMRRREGAVKCMHQFGERISETIFDTGSLLLRQASSRSAVRSLVGSSARCCLSAVRVCIPRLNMQRSQVCTRFQVDYSHAGPSALAPGVDGLVAKHSGVLMGGPAVQKNDIV